MNQWKSVLLTNESNSMSDLQLVVRWFGEGNGVGLQSGLGSLIINNVLLMTPDINPVWDKLA